MVPEGMSAQESLRLMGQVQMERLCNPRITPEEIALKLGLPIGCVRLWGFRDRLTRAELKGLSQYRYPEHREDAA